MRAFRNLNFTVTWFTNLRNLKEYIIFLFSSEKIITRYRRIGYHLNVMRQSACLVFNPIMVDNYAAFFNCTPRLYDGPDLKLFILVGAGASCLLLGPPGSNWCISFAPELVSYSAPRDHHRRAAYSICESWFLIH